MTAFEVYIIYILLTYCVPLTWFYIVVLGARNGARFLSQGLQWVQDYVSFYRGYQIAVDEWKTECCFKDTPSQKGNTTECGVILLATADYLSTDRQLDFKLSDLACYRKHLCLQILSHAVGMWTWCYTIFIWLL